MPPKAQRRSHTKSKHGCGQCKVRRIKCNEQHPVCSNCERRQITCDFSLPSAASGVPTHTSPTPTVSPLHTEDGSAVSNGRTSSQPSQVDPFRSPYLESTKKSSDLDISDLELLHHWTSVVALDMAGNKPEALPLWQTHIVQLGFRHEFLLRGILAVAALHLAYLRPRMKAEYDLKATTHQDVALSSFKDALADVDENNCHALFMFSCLIVLMAFASYTKTEASDLQIGVLNWFYLLRGANGVLQLHHDTLRNSFLAPFLDEMRHTETHAAHAIPDSDRITDLFRVCGGSHHEREVSQAYHLAIHSLLSTFIQASVLKTRGNGTVLASFVWPINLSPKFIELLSEKEPEALVILAHYCVLIHWGEKSDTWFLSGWARNMLNTIKRTVPESWHEHLVWPDIAIPYES